MRKLTNTRACLGPTGMVGPIRFEPRSLSDLVAFREITTSPIWDDITLHFFLDIAPNSENLGRRRPRHRSCQLTSPDNQSFA